jgi:hypothetical protein
LLHREISLVPFLGQIRHRVPAGLLPSLVLASLALKPDLYRFHAGERREMPLRGNVPCLEILLLGVDALLQIREFLGFRPRRKVLQLTELDLLLFRDHQRCDVPIDRFGNPRHAAASPVSAGRAPVVLFHLPAPVASV